MNRWPTEPVQPRTPIEESVMRMERQLSSETEGLRLRTCHTSWWGILKAYLLDLTVNSCLEARKVVLLSCWKFCLGVDFLPKSHQP